MITIFSQADIRVPLVEQAKLVRIEGEVAHAGIYSAEPGETLRHLVERAGGLTPNAYLFGAELTRESARIVQQQRLDDYVTQLELDVDRASARTAASALTPQDQSAATASLASTQLLVDPAAAVARQWPRRALRRTRRQQCQQPAGAAGGRWRLLHRALPAVERERGGRGLYPKLLRPTPSSAASTAI